MSEVLEKKNIEQNKTNTTTSGVVNTEDLDVLIFDNRNKNYGAFYNRKITDKNLVIATLISVIVFTTAIYSPMIYTKIMELLGSKVEEVEKTIDLVEVEMEDVALDPETPEPPKMEIEPPKVEMIRFLPPEIKPDEEVREDDIPPTVVELEDKANIGSTNQEGDTSLNMIIEDVGNGNKIVDDGEEVVYESVEEMPEFVGGLPEMKKFLEKHIVYPRSAMKMEIQGKVFISFEVAKDGKISNVKVLKGIHSECDAEALRVIQMMPNWVPGKQNGKAVAVKMRIPVNFKLPD